MGMGDGSSASGVAPYCGSGASGLLRCVTSLSPPPPPPPPPSPPHAASGSIMDAASLPPPPTPPSVGRHVTTVTSPGSPYTSSLHAPACALSTHDASSVGLPV